MVFGIDVMEWVCFLVDFVEIGVDLFVWIVVGGWRVDVVLEWLGYDVWAAVEPIVLGNVYCVNFYMFGLNGKLGFVMEWLRLWWL